MDRLRPGALRHCVFQIRMVAWIATFVLVVPTSGAVAQPGDLNVRAVVFPKTLDRDLAAMALLPADYSVEAQAACLEIRRCAPLLARFVPVAAPATPLA